MKLQEYKHVHCIGIGGIGLSAIARYCHAKGAHVQGSDGSYSRVTEDLEKEGITVYKGHDESNIHDDTDLVIYTIAINATNPELQVAKKQGIKCISYPEALGMLTEEYTTIAVCGTHGKTTTTAMIASMLTACGKNPTVIVGSLLAQNGLITPQNKGVTPDHSKNGLGTNFILGDSEYLVVEACEYRRSFLNLHPTHTIITNIDEDHLDYYKDLNDIQSAFQEFADKLPVDGSLTTHHDVSLVTSAKKINADEIEGTIELSVLGKHNISNARLALSLARTLGLNENDARKGLKDFTGTWRRLEYKGVWHDVVLYDDYGHHPREIKATLQAVREKYMHGKYKVIAVFQPHLYSRTKLLLDDFSQAFSDADTVCIMPIYAAREKDDGTVSSLDLVEKTHNAIYMETFEEVKKYVLGKPHYNTVLITIGAGDVYLFHNGLEDVVQ